MDFNDSLDAVNIVLGDTLNVTFTVEEKTRALNSAWNDSFVVDDVWNTAGTFLSTSYQTPLPTGVTAVRAIGVRASTSDFPEPISLDLYDIVGSNIQWTAKARYVLTTGSTLYILGTNKLTVVGTLDTTTLQEYVIALGAVNTLTLLAYKKANLFLKNDLSMSELITLKRELEKDVRDMRSQFAKVFQDMG